jgi:CheY-like chemotaxis protein
VPTLLLADDSLTTQKVVDLTFADEGIKVVTADDGDTALELFDHHKPDIVLADVNIPGLNGYEVCEKIRDREGADSTPVILLVGSFEPFDADEAHRVGANDYLTKPFSSIRRLVATVTALLDKPGPVVHSNGDDVATVADTKLDEPDMASTSDIDRLYSESFVETVEMPHTIAEREIYGARDPDPETVPVGNRSEAVAVTTALNTEEPVKKDDLAFDDELIEMHLANEPDQAETEDVHPQSEVEQVKAPVEEIQAAEKVFEDAAEGNLGSGQEQEEPNAWIASIDDVRHTSDPEPVVADAPTERLSLDELHEEAYFEPASEPISEESLPTEEYAVEERDIPTEPVPTPWDSIAEPAERKFELDEADLLELPGSSSARGSDSDAGRSQVNAISSEVVEQIARETALQISEELVREIAERIVPKVVEQVIARQAGEKTDR